MPIITKRHAFQKLWARNWISNVWNISMWFNIQQKYLLGSNDISTFTILWNSPALIRRGTYPEIMRACRPRISRPHCSTAAPSPVLLQSPQISCSAPSSVWHIANSAVILQWIDSVPSAQYAMPCNVSKLSPRPFSRLWPGAVAAVARLLTASNQFASLAGPRTGSSLTHPSGHWSVVTTIRWSGAGGKRQNVETWLCRAECSVLPNTRMGARTSLSGTIIYNQLHWNGRWWDKIFLRVPVTSKKMKKILFISNEASLFPPYYLMCQRTPVWVQTDRCWKFNL